MEETIITLAATKVLLALIASCGTVGCKVSIGLLRAVTGDVSLSSIGLDESGGWRMGVFERLFTYAQKRSLRALDVFDVVSYFAGNDHIEYFRVHPDAGMGRDVGPAAGLVSHVLLPLEADMVYRNAGYEIGFGGHTIAYDPKEKGVPCYHLGVVVNIPLTEEQVGVILAEQAVSEPFTAALARVRGPIVPSTEYWEALSSTIKSTARE